MQIVYTKLKYCVEISKLHQYINIKKFDPKPESIFLHSVVTLATILPEKFME